MEAIILAGGKGTRLASRLDNIPKPMALVAGRPFLEWLLESLAREGFERCVLSVGHLHHVIQDHFRDEFAGMALSYFVEEEPLGTGGAIRSALTKTLAESVFVLNGDTLTGLSYGTMMREHLKSRRALSMAVVHQEDASRYGRVLMENGRLAGFREKGTTGPGFINAGVYLLQRNFRWPESLPLRFSFENDFLAPQATELPVGCHVCDGYFIDIGVPEDLDRAQTEFGRLGRGQTSFDELQQVSGSGARPPRNL